VAHPFSASSKRVGYSRHARTVFSRHLQTFFSLANPAKRKSTSSGENKSRPKQLIVFVFNAIFYFSLFSAQKSHVKPLTHLTPYQTTTSTWHFSYAQPAILDIEIKKEASPAGI